MANLPLLLYTIGHSNRPLDAFVPLLTSVNVRTLVDVRAYPASRRHPQFEGSRLRPVLADAGVGYHWAGRQLGGFRQGKLESPHRALAAGALRAYADHMDTHEFQTGIDQLIRLAGKGCTAIMCAEKQPLTCHRSLIADYLSLWGARVLHLIDTNQVVEHRLTRLARCEGDRLIYDCSIQGQLRLDE